MSEGTEAQESKKQNLNKTEVPPRLELGQNFYDQEPFQSVIEKASEAMNVDSDKVRKAITYMAMAHFRQDKNSQYPLEKLVWFAFSYQKSGLRRSDANVSSMLKVLDALSEIPFWAEYIEYVTRGQKFYNNGSPNKNFNRVKDYKPPLIYPEWRNEKLKREEKLRFGGVGQIFEKATGSPTISSASINKLRESNRRETQEE